MKSLLLALALSVVASPSLALSNTLEFSTETPTYTLVSNSAFETKSEVATLQEQALQEHLRVSELDGKLEAVANGAANTSNNVLALAQIFKEMSAKIAELERKVAGLQKQVTILHAKGAKK